MKREAEICPATIQIKKLYKRNRIERKRERERERGMNNLRI